VLIAASTAGAGSLLLAAARIARVHGDRAAGDLAPWISEGGLRAGAVITATLLIIPVLVLTMQALRVGSVARDRRMAALRLAGATPGDVRALAATEAGAATFTGGLLAIWAYVLLWLLIGSLPPSGWRLLPAPDAVDLLVWLGVMLLAAIGGALAGAAVQRRAIAEPLGVFRRARADPPRRLGLVIPAAASAVVILTALTPISIVYAAPPITVLGITAAAIAGGPHLVWRCGRRLTQRDNAVEILAGWRLRADPHPPGRVAGVLIVCGIALGFQGLQVPDLLGNGLDDPFYVTGFGIAALITLVAASVAVLTLLVGAADQLLDARRPLATLVALGVEERVVAHVLARQLTAIAVPAVTLGVLIGSVVVVLLNGVLVAEVGNVLTGALIALGMGAGSTVIVAGLAAIAVTLAARLAARMLKPRLAEALDPENLRAA
jgi:hypothetical protein